MNILLKIKVLFYLHSHKFEQITKAVNCDLYDVKKNADKIKFQALSAFHIKNYYHARKCYEILSANNSASADDYNKLAYIYSRHNEKENAIISWCKALEKDRSNRVASKALEYVRNQGREINLIEDTYFEKLTCRLPLYIPFSKIFTAVSIFVLLSLIVFFSAKYVPQIVKNIIRSNKDVMEIIIDDYNPNILSEPKSPGDGQYSFSENEVRRKFDHIKERIVNNDVNTAIVTINMLKMSNASSGVKLKLDILNDFIEEPDYYLFNNTFNYRDIKDNIKLYDGIYVKWYGRIVNSFYDKKKKVIGFNLIMGDEGQGVIDGVVPVIFTKAVIAENNNYASVFGKVDAKDGKILIDGRFLIRD